jgi:hypothetical protein
MNDSTNELILFLHIPKSAGTTVHNFLNLQFGPEKVFIMNWQGNPEALHDYQKLTPAARDQLRAVTGHLQFGTHEHLGRPSTYITLLREPIDRLVSFYYYALEYPETYIHSVAKKMTLHEFMASNASVELDNLQIRLLVGKMSAPIGTLTSADAQQAKQNLRSHFAVAGVQDDVDGFLRAVCRHFKLPYMPAPSLNKTNKRPALAQVADATKNVIKERNALDLEIYDFVKNTLSPQNRWLHLTKKLEMWAHSTASIFKNQAPRKAG